MAINTAHSGAGIILFGGEQLLLQRKNVELSFENAPSIDHLKGTKKGGVYLTNQRLIFKSSSQDVLMSLSMPFYYMKDFEIKQPTFGANYLGGRILAQPGGDWSGEARFKMVFKSGGAMDVGQLLIKVASNAPRQPPPHPKSQGTAPQPSGAQQPAQPYPQPTQPYPQPMPQAYPQGYPEQPYPVYNGYPPAAPPAGYAYPPAQPYNPPPGVAPGEMPPSYDYAMGTGAPPNSNAYYTPSNPGQVYVPQPPPATVPTAPPSDECYKPKLD